MGNITTTESKLTKLKSLEHKINDRAKRIEADFFEMGQFLKTIVREELYKATHSSLEEYCRARLPFNRKNCYEMIKAAEIKEELQSSFNKVPLIQSQYRPLMPLLPEERAAVWGKLLEKNPEGIITAEQIKAMVQKVKPKPSKGSQQTETPNTVDTTAVEVPETVEVIDTPEQLDTARYIEVPQNRDDALKMLVARDIKIKTQQKQIQHLEDLVASLNKTIEEQQHYTQRPKVALDSKFFELPPDDRAFTEENRERNIQYLKSIQNLAEWAATELEWTHYIHREGIQLEAEVHSLRERDTIARIACQQVQYQKIEIQGLKEQLQALAPEPID